MAMAIAVGISVVEMQERREKATGRMRGCKLYSTR